MDPKHLERLARDTDEQHREAMRTLHDDLAAVHFGQSSPTVADSRRRFLRRAASSTTAIAFGSAAFTLPMLMGASPAQAQGEGGTTGGSTSGSTPGSTRTGTPGSARTGGTAAAGPTTTAAPHSRLPMDEVELVRFAESVERAAVATYEAAVATRLFTPAVDEVLRLFGRHHTEHANAHLAILTADPLGKATFDGKPAEANPVLLEALQGQLRAATDLVDREAAAVAVTRIAYDLEEGAAATYLLALGVLETQAVAEAVATILPIESQHAVVLGQALELPVDDYLPSLQTEAASLSPSAYALS